MDDVMRQLIRDLNALRESQEELRGARIEHKLARATLGMNEYREIREFRKVAAQARKEAETALETVAKTAGKIASLWLLEQETSQKERRNKMKRIVTAELDDKLTTLGVARERLESAQEAAARAESPYRFAIKLIEAAMEEDRGVVDARCNLTEMRQIEEDAMTCVSKAAIELWAKDKTDGAKEWRHAAWEIRLRTTFKPVVAHIGDFIAHVAEIKAFGIVKNITLNRKDTTDLDAKLEGGLGGLTIEKKTTCSARRV